MSHGSPYSLDAGDGMIRRKGLVNGAVIPFPGGVPFSAMEHRRTYRVKDLVRVTTHRLFFPGVGMVVEATPEKDRYVIEMANGIKQELFGWHLEPIEDVRRIQAAG
jgi:formylmethanofuran:tetrahydromethanopterin formyltransferase